MTSTVVFDIIAHAVFLVLAAGLGWRFWKEGRNAVLWAVVAGVIGAALPMVWLIVLRQPFGAFRTLAWLTFLYGPLALGVAAWRDPGPMRWAAGVVAACLVAIGVDAFLIEPTMLQTTRYEIVSDRVEEPLRIAVLSDIQTDAPGPFVRRAVRVALDAEPDLILLPGDYVQTARGVRAERVQDLRRIFEEEGLDAPLGVYAVRGNVEWDGWERDLFDGLPVHAREHSETWTVPHAGGAVSVTALSFRDGFNPGLQVPRAAGLHIVVGHAPDYSLGRIEADVLVAGHTHGGQVRLPGLGPLITFSRVPRDWAAGRTEVGDTTLVVSRGIGMERADAPRLRFLCPPEVVLIDVVPEL